VLNVVNIGRVKANVFPEPVAAIPKTCEPRVMSWKEEVWIELGFFIFKEERFDIRTVGTPKSLKLVAIDTGLVM